MFGETEIRTDTEVACNSCGKVFNCCKLEEYHREDLELCELDRCEFCGEVFCSFSCLKLFNDGRSEDFEWNSNLEVICDKCQNFYDKQTKIDEFF